MSPESAERWIRMSEFIAEKMGLHFPSERWPELERGVCGAAKEFGFKDVGPCVDWLLSSTPTETTVQVLASHLTIGETHFFRDIKTMDALSDGPLKELIQSRRGRDQRLRLWSAACCTGEEPYSLAMLLHDRLPDLADWHVTILATDINVNFLKKARAGKYGEWSFRGVSDTMKKRYFRRSQNGQYMIAPRIQEMVTFAYMNLVEDAYPSLSNGTNAMDLILCRNALMYFTEEQKGSVVRKLHHSLTDEGWLAVSPSEVSQWTFSQFTSRNFPGATLYRKCNTGANGVEKATIAAPPTVNLRQVTAIGTLPEAGPMQEMPEFVNAAPPPPAPKDRPAEDVKGLRKKAQSLYEEGRYAEATRELMASCAEETPTHETYSMLTRALANQGKLGEARNWCDRWIASDKLDPAAHYLMSVIFMEEGKPEEAREALRRAVYLRPDFVLAHFALGNLARDRDREGEMAKHFENALGLLAQREPTDILPESDGLTAGRLTETITALTRLEHAS